MDQVARCGSSLIQNLMLAWLLLREGFSTPAGIGFTIAALGVVAVQLRRLPRRRGRFHGATER